MKTKRITTRIITWLAAIVTTVVVIIFPLGYFFITYQEMAASLETEAEINANMVTQIISANPEFWEFEHIRLAGYLTWRPKQGYAETRRIVNIKNEIIAESADELKPPVIMRSAALMDSGAVVGRLEIFRSLRPVLQQTGLIALLVFPIGLGAFITLRILPIRTIYQAERSLQKTNEELEKANEQLQREITERRRMEEVLREKEAKFHELFNGAPVGYHEYDNQGKIIRVNRTELEMLGYTAEEMVGQPVWKFIGEEEVSQRMVLAKLAGGIPPDRAFERTYRRKDGSTFPVIIEDRLLKDTEGRITGIYSTIQDITERKRAEEALKEREGRYRAILENIQEGYYEVDLAGNFTFFNPSMVKILGYAEEDMMGMNYRLYMDKETAKKVFRDFNEVYRTGISSRLDYEQIRSDGSKMSVETSVALMRDSFGQPIGFRGIVRDITKSKLAERALEESFKRLRKALGGIIQAISVAVETRDPYTAGHQRRVSDLARAIATEMNLSSDQIDGIRTASVIHDIGKLSIPSEILSKPTKLTEIEFSLIKIHSQAGYDILKDIEFPWPIARMVLEHHERMDGSGYPNGLNGENLLIESKILAIADVVEAIASHRPYRPAKGIDAALDEIAKNKGVLYDPEVVEACLKLFHEKGYTFDSSIFR